MKNSQKITQLKKTNNLSLYFSCRYVGALTGIFSFILFLPCLFKETYGIQEKNLIKEGNEIENSVDYLRSCSNVLDMNFGEANNAAEESLDKSVSSLDTASSGFGSADLENPCSGHGKKEKLHISSKLLEVAM